MNQETCCNTFAPRTFVNAIKSAFNTNYAGTIMQALDSQEDVDHKIKCYAMNCTYNVGMTCTSTDIQVLDQKLQHLLQLNVKLFITNNS